jgi:O6-methylguanine-DNA--protein-cysteine methyltransferase
VVRSDGTIGNYLGGIETKRALLEMETSGPAENR